MSRGAAPTSHAWHTLSPLSADLPRHPRRTGGSRPAGQPVLPWGTGSPWGCHHLHREVQPGGVIRHPFCGKSRPRSAPAGMKRCRGATGPRHPLTIKHLVQLLLDEPLDLIVIHHVSLGGTQEGPSPPDPVEGWGSRIPAAPPYHHPRGSWKPRVARRSWGAGGAPFTRGTPWTHKAHGATFPRPPGHAGSAFLPRVAPLAGRSSFTLRRHGEAGLSPGTPGSERGCGVPGWRRWHGWAFFSPSGRPVPRCRVFLGGPGETQRSRVTGMSPPWGHHGQAGGCHNLALGSHRAGLPQNPHRIPLYRRVRLVPAPPAKSKRGRREMPIDPRGPRCTGAQRSVPPLVPRCTHWWSWVARGSWLSWHPWQTSLPHGAPLALQPLRRGRRRQPGSESAKGMGTVTPKPALRGTHPAPAVLTTPARPAGPGCPGLPGGPWGAKRGVSAWGGDTHTDMGDVPAPGTGGMPRRAPHHGHRPGAPWGADPTYDEPWGSLPTLGSHGSGVTLRKAV